MKNRLRVLRAEREWSQADLAERLEVSRQSVNAIETGKFDPSLPLRSSWHDCLEARSKRFLRMRNKVNEVTCRAAFDVLQVVLPASSRRSATASMICS